MLKQQMSAGESMPLGGIPDCSDLRCRSNCSQCPRLIDPERIPAPIDEQTCRHASP